MHRRTAFRQSMVLVFLGAALGGLGGCATSFSQRVADHPGCVADVGIARWKIEQCSAYGNVQRDAFNICLARHQVPSRRIDMLNQCVDTRSGY